VDEEHREDPRFLHTLAELWHQTDEVPLTDQTRGQRKAIKERRKAREKAQSTRTGSPTLSRSRHIRSTPRFQTFCIRSPLLRSYAISGMWGPSAGIGRRSNYLSGPVSTLDAGRVR